MKKLLNTFWVVIFALIFWSSCKEKTVCLECTITIAGLESVQPKICDDLDTVDEELAKYQEIVDRENEIVGESASLDCIKYILP